jgi:hypothetical protein
MVGSGSGINIPDPQHWLKITLGSTGIRTFFPHIHTQRLTNTDHDVKNEKIRKTRNDFYTTVLYERYYSKNDKLFNISSALGFIPLLQLGSVHITFLHVQQKQTCDLLHLFQQ